MADLASPRRASQRVSDGVRVPHEHLPHSSLLGADLCPRQRAVPVLTRRLAGRDLLGNGEGVGRVRGGDRGSPGGVGLQLGDLHGRRMFGHRRVDGWQEGGGRHWRGAATSQGTPGATGRGKKGPPLKALRGHSPAAPLVLDFGPQRCARINPCLLRPSELRCLAGVALGNFPRREGGAGLT